MQTKLKGFWEKVKSFFAKLNKKTRILLGICAGVILVMIIAAVLLLNRKEYVVLRTGLTASETSTIVQFLSDNGVTDYQIQGDSVLVPKGREIQLQSQLALSNYSTTGFLYPYYTEHSGGITTSDEQRRAFLISTQERLEAIIRTFEGVREASVTIAPGTDRVYVLDPKSTPATASVVVTPDGNRQLSNGVVNAIRNTVARSVQGLEISNISIEDTLGNTYSSGNATDSIGEASAMKLMYEEQVSNQVRTQVLQALEDIYGPDNVRVAVNSTIDINRKVINSTQYQQPEGSVDGGGLIGKDQWYWELIRDGTTPVGGTVGTPTNSDIPYYPNLDTNLTGDENYAGAQGDREHKIDTTTQQEEVLAFTITDVRVAVTINQNCTNANSLGTDALKSHVATASGIGTETPEEHVSVIIAPFDRPTPTPSGDGFFLPTDSWVLYAAIGGLVLFLILLILILLLRSRSKKKKLAQQQALEEELRLAEAEELAKSAALAPPPTDGADIMEINTEKSMELRKTVRQFAQNNPEIAAQMVKAWLRGGEDDNG